MDPKDFARLENLCQSRFMEAGSCFHVCSQENHPVLFHNDEEFTAAMNIVAFSALLFPDVRIFTFEVMANHFHFAMAGEKSGIKLLLRALVNKMASLPSLSVSRNDIRKLDFKFFDINSLDNMRNVIAYINRNGAVVSREENVFTYLWGANRFFFNREAQLRHAECGRKASCREKRSMFRSAQFDTADIMLVDDSVSPLFYCRIEEGESFFAMADIIFIVYPAILNHQSILQRLSENVCITLMRTYFLISEQSAPVNMAAQMSESSPARQR